MIERASQSCRRGVLVVMALLLLAQATWADPLRIGSIGVEAVTESEVFLPLARYLEKQLRPDGVDRGMVVVAKGIPEMATFLRQGKVDLYIDSPFPSLAVSHLSGSKFLLRRWKKGLAEYHAVIFAKKDGGVTRVDDLPGKIIGFEEPWSTSGYFLPKVVLVQRGLKLVQKNEPADLVRPGELGYVFTYDDETTMVWVLRGKVSAGAMDHQNYQRYAKGALDNLQIVQETFSLPRQIVSYRRDLSPALVSRVRDVLIRMHESDEGREALHEFERTTKFDELREDATEALSKLQRFIGVELRGR